MCLVSLLPAVCHLLLFLRTPTWNTACYHLSCIVHIHAFYLHIPKPGMVDGCRTITTFAFPAFFPMTCILPLDGCGMEHLRPALPHPFTYLPTPGLCPHTHTFCMRGGIPPVLLGGEFSLFWDKLPGQWRDVIYLQRGSDVLGSKTLYKTPNAAATNGRRAKAAPLAPLFGATFRHRVPPYSTMPSAKL